MWLIFYAKASVDENEIGTWFLFLHVPSMVGQTNFDNES